MPVWRGNNDAEIEIAREDLKEHIEWANKNEVLIVGGDFNAHIGLHHYNVHICENSTCPPPPLTFFDR